MNPVINLSITYIRRLKKKDKTSLMYVKGWYKNFNEPSTQLKGSNSYIAPDPYFEYQLDLFFLQTNQHQI